MFAIKNITRYFDATTSGFILFCVIVLQIILFVSGLYITIICLVFENSIYLPFYLHNGYYFMIFTIMANILYIMKKDIWKPALIIMAAVSSFTAFGWLIYIYPDLILISKNQYNTAECKVGDIIITPSQMRYSVIYRIQIATEIDGKNINVQLSSSQYKEIMDKSKGDYQKTATIYYLPNTGILLKYDFTMQ